MRPTCRVGTATGCRSSCRSKRSTAAPGRSSMPRHSGPPAAPSPRSRSIAAHGLQAPRRARATGIIPIAPWIRATRRSSCAPSARSSRNGHVYRGAKPVHWCLDCRSALAEAEVEYEERTSPAIDVAFRVVDRGPRAAAPGLPPEQLCTGPVDAVIWTTTPWTLPANEAVALRDDFRYVAGRGRTRGSATRLHPRRGRCSTRAWSATGMTRLAMLADATRPRARGTEAAASVLERIVPIILGEHVTLEAGTGAVHTAPAHGQEDFAGRPALRAAGRQSRWAMTAASCPSTPLVAGD